MDLTLSLELGEQRRERGVADRLYGELRKAVLEGRLGAGEKLPSTRDLAAAQALSRNTVSHAYDRLAREGYIQTRRGSGTFVAPQASDFDRTTLRSNAPAPP
jgi:GntR family transcriptional regulator/MocR family aminotransferase